VNEIANLPTVASPPTALQWPVNALERMNLCRELATARLVPPAFQKSPADIFLIMNTLERLGLDFFLTIGECFVQQGKVGFQGKVAAAMLNSSGRLAERLSYSYEGQGDDRTITVSARLHGETAPRTVDVRLGDAKTTNAQWVKQPDQQLGYSGARRWGRLHLPEVILGMTFHDEVQDMIDVTPMAHVERTMSASDLPQAAPVEQPPEVEHAAPIRLGDPNGPEQWRAWAQSLITHVRAARTVAEIDQWLDLNAGTLATMRNDEPKMLRMLDNAINQQRDMRAEMQANDAR
jgi:hypothetical protein